MSPKAKVAVMVSVLGTTVAANASAAGSSPSSAPTMNQPASSSALSFDSIVRYLTNLIRPVMDN